MVKSRGSCSGEAHRTGHVNRAFSVSKSKICGRAAVRNIEIRRRAVNPHFVIAKVTDNMVARRSARFASGCG